MSVHQLSTYTTVVELHKTVISRKPDFAARKCSKLHDSRTKQGQLREELSRLDLRVESFLPKAVKIYNHVPNELKHLCLADFQKEVKKWIQLSVSVKP